MQYQSVVVYYHASTGFDITTGLLFTACLLYMVSTGGCVWMCMHVSVVCMLRNLKLVEALIFVATRVVFSSIAPLLQMLFHQCMWVLSSPVLPSAFFCLKCDELQVYWPEVTQIVRVCKTKGACCCEL